MKLEEYARMYRAEERHWWYAGMRSISFALLGGRPEEAGPVLDVGCGSGGFLAQLGSRARAFGVDISPEATRLCRSRGVAAVRAGIGALPFRDGSFGLVTCFDVVYHHWVGDDRE